MGDFSAEMTNKANSFWKIAKIEHQFNVLSFNLAVISFRSVESLSAANASFNGDHFNVAFRSRTAG